MKVKLLKCGIVLVVILVAAFAAYLWLVPNPARPKLAESVKRSQYVFDRYFNADNDTAHQSILGHIEYLDRLSSEEGDQVRNPFATDAMAWCVRSLKKEAKELTRESTCVTQSHDVRN